MPRSIWTGAISFGLVTVPVRLSPAVRRHSVSFHQLHARDGARIQHRRFCSAEDREVPREELELPAARARGDGGSGRADDAGEAGARGDGDRAEQARSPA